MPLAVGFVVLVCALAVVLWLTWSTRQEVNQVRRELDVSQRHVNELRAEVTQLAAEVRELKTAAEAVAAAPPPLPRSRSSGLEDLREQLRAAHREESADSE